MNYLPVKPVSFYADKPIIPGIRWEDGSITALYPGEYPLSDRHNDEVEYDPSLGIVRIFQLGLKAPTSAPALAEGAVDAGFSGTYKYLITFYRSGNYPCESNPSPESAPITVTGHKVSLSGIEISSDSRVDKRRIYRTTNGGAIYYWLDDISDNTTTTYTDNLSELGDEVSYDRGIPAIGSTMEVWDDRLWIAGNPDYPNHVYYTNVGTAEEMAEANIIPLKTGPSDYITVIKSFNDVLYVFKNDSVFSISKVGDNEYQTAQVLDNIGCDAPGTVEVGENLMIWKSKYGIELFNGYSCLRPILSSYIKRTLASINQARVKKSVAAISEVTGEYWLSIPTGANTEPNKVILFNYFDKNFTLYEFAEKMTCFGNIRDSDKKDRKSTRLNSSHTT
jgi:hypothetical protein